MPLSQGATVGVLIGVLLLIAGVVGAVIWYMNRSNEKSKPSSDPSKPSSDAAKPSSDPSQPSSDPAKPPSDPAKPSSDPAKPSSDPSQPSSDPTKPSSDPSRPAPPPAPEPAPCSSFSGSLKAALNCPRSRCEVGSDWTPETKTATAGGWVCRDIANNCPDNLCVPRESNMREIFA
jgi:predicted lipid-binding transport protein (Tim44 family)